MKVLVVEDSPLLQDRVARALRKVGYAVEAVGDGPRAAALACSGDFDVIVLDLMLPGLDGLGVLKRLRDARRTTHVLILTALDSIDDRVRGLRAGADDYLIKPFALDELIARVDALARRGLGVKDPRITLGKLTVDTTAKRALCNDAAIDLTPREYSVLEHLAFRRGAVVTRAQLEEHLYEDRKQVLSNAIDSAVCSLRAKLERAGVTHLIHTRRGLGYVLEARDAAESHET